MVWHVLDMIQSQWAALADPTRRSALDLLRRAPRSVNDVATGLGITQPSASKHLKVLRDVGLVRVQRDAQRRIYEIDTRPLADLDAWLAPYRRLWNDRLDALGRHLDATAEQKET